jgi:dihydropyrimidinase
MSTYDLVVKNGSVIIPAHGIVHTDIGITGETISCLGKVADEQAAHIIDATGKYVLPGLIDPHVHLGMYHPFYQDLQNESKAAAAGGVTTIMTTLASLDRLDALDTTAGQGTARTAKPARYSDIFPQLLEDIKGCSSVDFVLRCIIGTKEHIDEMEFCYRRFGVGSFKFFTAYKDRPEVSGVGDGIIYQLLKATAKIDPPPMPQVHCENNDIVEMFTQEVKMSGMDGLRAWNAARPNVAEEVDIAKVCLLARRAGSPIYIVHVSTAEGVEIVAEEQQKGTQVIGETCVHYLGLTEGMSGVVGKVSPPLRKQHDVDALWEGIANGVITCVGSDNVTRVKELKNSDIWTACMAWPAMEILLPAMLTHALERKIALTTVAELCSLNCAKVFRLFPKKGTIAVGSDADLVIVDLSHHRTVDPSRFSSVGKYNPYDGMSLIGWPEITLLRGKIIFDHGNFTHPIGRNIEVTPEGAR